MEWSVHHWPCTKAVLVLISEIKLHNPGEYSPGSILSSLLPVLPLRSHKSDENIVLIKICIVSLFKNFGSWISVNQIAK